MEKFRIVGKTTRKFLTRKMIMKNEKKNFQRIGREDVNEKTKWMIN